MVRGMYGVQIEGRKRSMDLMLKLGLNEVVDELAMESSVHWLRLADGHVLRKALILKVKGWCKRMRKK